MKWRLHLSLTGPSKRHRSRFEQVGIETARKTIGFVYRGEKKKESEFSNRRGFDAKLPGRKTSGRHYR